jgi:simple sugar transport system permease protein
LALAWLAFDILAIAYGLSPLALASTLLSGTWATGYGVGQVLFKATPLVIAAVGIDVALRAGLFNVGAEGQLAVASLAVAAAGARLGAVPAPIAIPLVLAIGAGAGGAWALVPGILRARAGAHEVISTIMMNKIAESLVGALLASGLALEGTVRTRDLPASVTLSRLDAGWVGDVARHAELDFRGSAVNTALGIAVGLLLVVRPFYRHVRVGRELELVRMNERACTREHVPVVRRKVQGIVLSGAIVGLASAATVLGYKGYFEEGLGSGIGFAGLGVALLGRRTPLGIAFFALVFATLQQGGLAVNALVPKESMDVLAAIVVVTLALADGRLRGLLAGTREVPS